MTALFGSGFNRYTVLNGPVHPAPVQLVDEGKMAITLRLESQVTPTQYPSAPAHDAVLSRLVVVQLAPLQLSMLRILR